MSNRESEFGAFISGFVIGGLVGAAVALLMAPQSGEDTRAYIRDRGIELRDSAYDTAETTRVRVGEMQQRGQVVLEEQKQRLSGAIDAGKQAAQRKRAEVGTEEVVETVEAEETASS